MVERDLITGKFHLGIKLIELGYSAQLELDICKIAIPFLYGLNLEFDETIHLTVLDNDQVLYVACIESTRRLRTNPVLGYRAPLYCTAVGKAILAFQSEEEICRIIKEQPLEKFTPNTLNRTNRLLDELAKIRQQGYAIDNMEHEEHLRCIGAPIRNAQGYVFASISLSGPAERNTLGRLKSLAPAIMDRCIEISKRLGYPGNQSEIIKN
jgi:DNA-binding IclR family transcriptional regulator